MRNINWTYDSMYKAYSKQHMINNISTHEPLLIIVYESKKPSQKDATKLEPFIKNNIKYVGLATVQDFRLFPNSIYLAYDDNKSNKQWMYFIFPNINKNGFIAANHFTFCYDKSDKKKPCHFHSTYYTNLERQNNTLYKCDHEKDFMSDTLKLPQQEGDIFKKHKDYKSFLLETIKYPWTSNNLSFTGGTKEKVKVKERKILPKALPIRNPDFCNYWQESGMKRMIAIGTLKNNKYHWNISFREKGRLSESILYDSYHIVTNSGDDHELKIMEHVVNKI